MFALTFHEMDGHFILAICLVVVAGEMLDPNVDLTEERAMHRCSPEDRSRLYRLWRSIMESPRRQEAFASHLLYELISTNPGAAYIMRKSKDEQLMITWKAFVFIDSFMSAFKSDLDMHWFIRATMEEYKLKLDLVDLFFVEDLFESMADIIKSILKTTEGDSVKCLTALFEKLYEN